MNKSSNAPLGNRSFVSTILASGQVIFSLVFMGGLIVGLPVRAAQTPLHSNNIVSAQTTVAARSTATQGKRQVPDKMHDEHKNERVGSRVLLELFTSQGCSSCPKADALLPTFIARKDVIVLSLSIDYWDYLGWRDTFGQSIFTARQRFYGKKIGDGVIYTPQMVVDGRHHVNGGDKKAIEQLIAQRKKARASFANVALDVTTRGDMLLITVGGSKNSLASPKGTLWMALFSKKETVKIRRGENRGRYLTYHNIVRELTPIGRWVGEKMVLKLPKKQIMRRGADGCVVLLQKGDGGPILAAAQMANW